MLRPDIGRGFFLHLWAWVVKKCVTSHREIIYCYGTGSLCV